MAGQPLGEYVLGIDLGTNSIGWAIVGLVDGEPAKLVRAGVRAFEAGMEGNIESGREKSRNKARRDARLQRRQLWRHRRRLVKVAHALQRIGLLPEGNLSDPDARQDFFNRLDAEILASHWFAAKEKSALFPEPRHVMPYILRAAALDEKLEPHYVGRALYHLAQRRVFLSNRKQAPKNDDNEGKVKEGIAELRKSMQENHSRTLGEYLAHLGPSEERIRSRWTARDMYQKEFGAIWSAEARHYPGALTEDRRKELYKAIFFQRPLWLDPNTIGECELDPGERRAPAYLLVSQRFRLLQTVNNLRLLPPGEPETPLTPADRQKLIEELEIKGDLKFDKVRKLLGLEKEYVFSVERGGEKAIKGNRTNADLYKMCGGPWLNMTREERDRRVEYIHAFQKPDKLKDAAIKKWNLNEEAAERLAQIALEPDYLNLSRRAIQKLLPLLEQGMTYAEARKAAYPESFKSTEPKPLLPPVEQSLEIRNPAVMRSLTEFRKVVNAVIGHYGKPQLIRIELARELKKSKKQRDAVSKRNRENQAAREKAKETIKDITGDEHPSRDDVRRVQLFNDSCGRCVYCGESIAARNFLGRESQTDIDHIIPFSRSMDDSYPNLVICHARCNREKGDRTPFEAFSGDGERYDQIKDRVKKFAGDRRTVSEKIRRFQMDQEELERYLGDFRHRQLNDTAYASRLAADYLGLLYGGRIDQQHNLRVQATAGESTARLRARWKLNSILDDGPTTDGGRAEKKRTDHRHHAIDAVVVGVTDAGMMERLADAAKRGQGLGRRFARLDEPWNGFFEEVRNEVGRIVASHRVSKKVSGALHEETIYSRPIGGMGEVRVRKPLAALTKTEFKDIADWNVRAIVQQKLEELGGDPKKFADEKNLPRFASGVTIKRVRIIKKTPTVTLGGGRRARQITPGSNHHIEIFAELDVHGKQVEWDGAVVAMLDAMRRLKLGEPVVRRDHGPHRVFKFSLAQGEVVECDDKQHGRSLFVFRKVSQLAAGEIQIGFAPLNDARKAREVQVSRAWLWATPNTLGKRNGRKVVVSPLGEVTEAHD
jgi:CRISPR-associated endonuclease Csn1